eukprot:TRINITY_DN8581_c0_g1_i3.p1 TRINITY_DN8581_c0_g1~~TRINITY_DN8581_c0_g1_i3.p1  ORF type:complete len:871 (+),score=290.44 TRINITY_DN8581_c0_g1_i3:214-2826(+)
MSKRAWLKSQLWSGADTTPRSQHRDGSADQYCDISDGKSGLLDDIDNGLSSWSCPRCTFVQTDPDSPQCEMCGAMASQPLPDDVPEPEPAPVVQKPAPKRQVRAEPLPKVAEPPPPDLLLQTGPEPQEPGVAITDDLQNLFSTYQPPAPAPAPAPAPVAADPRDGQIFEMSCALETAKQQIHQLQVTLGQRNQDLEAAATKDLALNQELTTLKTGVQIAKNEVYRLRRLIKEAEEAPKQQKAAREAATTVQQLRLELQKVKKAAVEDKRLLVEFQRASEGQGNADIVGSSGVSNGMHAAEQIEDLKAQLAGRESVQAELEAAQVTIRDQAEAAERAAQEHSEVLSAVTVAKQCVDADLEATQRALTQQAEAAESGAQEHSAAMSAVNEANASLQAELVAAQETITEQAEGVESALQAHNQALIAVTEAKESLQAELEAAQAAMREQAEAKARAQDNAEEAEVREGSVTGEKEALKIDLEATQRALTQQAEAAESGAQEHSAAMSAVTEANASLQAELAAAQAAMGEQAEALDRVRGELEGAQQSIGFASEVQAAQQKELEDVKAEAAAIAIEHAALLQERNDIEEVAQEQLVSIQEQLVSTQGELRDRTRELALSETCAEQRQEVCDEQLKELQGARRQLDHNSVEHEVALRCKSHAEQESAQLRDQLHTLQAELESQRQGLDTLAETERANGALEDQVDRLEAQLMDLMPCTPPVHQGSPSPSPKSSAKKQRLITRQNQREAEMNRVFKEMLTPCASPLPEVPEACSDDMDDIVLDTEEPARAAELQQELAHSNAEKESLQAAFSFLVDQFESVLVELEQLSEYVARVEMVREQVKTSQDLRRSVGTPLSVYLGLRASDGMFNDLSSIK